MKTILVSDSKDCLPFFEVDVVSVEAYLTEEVYKKKRGFRIINLCSTYSYQHNGYYVSLLASARSHKVTPNLSTILEMRSPTHLRITSHSLDDLIQKSLKDIKSERFELSIYFGCNMAKKYDKLAKVLHTYFHAPLLRAKFVRKDKWQLSHIGPISLKDVPPHHKDDLQVFGQAYFRSRRKSSKGANPKFSLAILVDPEEALPPSNEKALHKFRQAASRLHIDTEFITKDDLARLVEFDALFIRTTTAVNHYTYRFAQKAKAYGLVVIDDPDSILKCTNKVYLSELFEAHRISAPKTLIVHRSNYKAICSSLKQSVVLKQPDSAFSKGVIRIDDPDKLQQSVRNMLQESDLILIQEYIPTPFDWRIGVLDGRAIYGCKYYMARNHWQIYRQGDEGQVEDGAAETLPLRALPLKLIELAEKVARVVGDGLYGIDIKEVKGKFYVIEINDNPSIDQGVEDGVLGGELYHMIMNHFLTKLQARLRGG